MPEFWRIVVSLGVPGLALGVFYMLYKSALQKWKFPQVPKRWVVPVVTLYLVLAAVVVLVAIHRWAPPRQAVGPYTVRVTVLAPGGSPGDGARVWSSVGGEAKKVEGGWEIEIPGHKKPASGEITVFAAQESSFLYGSSSIKLASDPYVGATVHLHKEAVAGIRGIIVDETGKALVGATVGIESDPGAAVTTSGNGSFSLSAHAAVGEMVFLRAEKPGFQVLRQLHPAGGDPAYLVLQREKP